MSIENCLEEATKILKNVTTRPLLEAQILLSNILNKDRIYLHLHSNEMLDRKVLNHFFEDVKKRAKNYPIEYITKRVSFYSQEFYIKEGVLIPRPETELLVEKVLENVDTKKSVTIAEIGFGSGVVSIMLAKKLKNAKIVATDISIKALEVARENIKKHKVEKKVELRLCSFLECVDEKIDIIVSNPPYISQDFKLDKNILYEPKEALIGGKKGDEILKKIIDIALIKKAKLLICEMGYDQRESIKEYCNIKNLKPNFYKDLAFLDRGFVLRLN